MGPQQWQDKFMSTMLHLIASSPKGGLLAEAGAFVDIRDAEAKWNRSESIILASEGALSNNRIIPKPQTPYPQGIDRLLEITQGSMKEVAGISPEMMGMSENVQAGVLENTRRQASIAVLSWAFNSLRIYRKLCSRLTMSYVREYMADGRLARIHMDNGEKYLPIHQRQIVYSVRYGRGRIAFEPECSGTHMGCSEYTATSTSPAWYSYTAGCY